ncbi:MAG TPA: arginine deiminase family protein [Dongiaceae bacterium]|nr:arginine deiminase family protein [Dongiaceae bacterium]
MTHGGSSMVASLRRVLLAEPDTAGWGDPERIAAAPALGYPRPADPARARAEHAALAAALVAAEVEILALPPAREFSLDAVFTHDASFMTDAGAILLSMGKPERAAEPARHGAFYERIGVPILGRIDPPGTVEGGDLVWLDAATILAGRGYRTNAVGIEQLRALVAPAGVEVVAAPLPHGQGPECCLHLMSLLSLLDETTALVDVAWLSVPTLELLRDRGYALIPIEPAERDQLAGNVLSLGRRRLLAMEGSPETRRRMEAAGFEVRLFPGRELGMNGGGGPTCLTRPILRGES